MLRPPADIAETVEKMVGIHRLYDRNARCLLVEEEPVLIKAHEDSCAYYHNAMQRCVESAHEALGEEVACRCVRTARQYATNHGVEFFA